MFIAKDRGHTSWHHGIYNIRSKKSGENHILILKFTLTTHLLTVRVGVNSTWTSLKKLIKKGIPYIWNLLIWQKISSGHIPNLFVVLEEYMKEINKRDLTGMEITENIQSVMTKNRKGSLKLDSAIDDLIRYFCIYKLNR